MKKTTIHREGINILISIFVILGCTNYIILRLTNQTIFDWTLSISAILFLFCMAFFRSPKRITYPSCDDILAPADGKVVVIEKTIETEYFKKEMIQISIFMSLFNVHANWIPFAGKVKYVNHQKGNYHAAYLPKASTENERTSTVIECKHNGEEGLVRQIAGAIARRIITYPKVGDEVTINGQLGFIKFGSRVDLFLPADKVEIYAEYGDKTRANQTILAKWK